MRAGAAAERLDQVGELLVLRQLVLAGAGDVEDLAAQRQHRLRGAVARLLGRAAGEVALDDENLGAFAAAVWCSRRACRAGAACAPRSCARFPFPAGGAGARRRARSRIRAACWPASDWPASQWSNGSLIAFSTMRCASAVASRSLVWPWNSGSRMNTDSMQPAPVITSSVVTARGALVLADAVGVILEAAQQRGAQAGFMRAAVRRRDGVAVGIEEAVGVGGPGDRPFDRAVAAGLAGTGR